MLSKVEETCDRALDPHPTLSLREREFLLLREKVRMRAPSRRWSLAIGRMSLIFLP
jgi:hypothetical protein